MLGLLCAMLLGFSGLAATAQQGQLVEPPDCLNHKGETVNFIATDRGRPGLAAGMARRDADGTPVVIRSKFADATPDLQRFIDRHECGHHQTGDIDRPHPPRNSPEHLMNESISDCIAILRLRDEDKYGRDDIERVIDALSKDMKTIGFPEISISSRVSNMNHCYANLGPAADLIDKVLKERGLKD